MSYVQLTLHRKLSHLQAIQFRQSEDALFLDETTVTNLELVNPLYTHRSGQKIRFYKLSIPPALRWEPD